MPPCRQNPAAAAPRRVLFIPFSYGLTVSDPVRPGPARWPTGPRSLTVASILSRRARRCSDLACGTGLHRIDRVARIHHDSRSKSSVFVAGVAPVTTVMLRGFVLAGRRPARTRAGVPGVSAASTARWYWRRNSRRSSSGSSLRITSGSPGSSVGCAVTQLTLRPSIVAPLPAAPAGMSIVQH